jgi:hypothetical protein
MDVYNSLMAEDAKDRKSLYKKLQSEMESTEKRRAAISMRADEARTEADILFKSWADSATAISDPALRKKSEERLSKTKASYSQIGAAGREASDAYGPVMKTLQDQVTFLGHDLNPSAVASLKTNAAKLNSEVADLVKKIDATITTANTSINNLRPQ